MLIFGMAGHSGSDALIPSSTSFLKALPYFEGLPQEDLARVSRKAVEIIFRKGEVIFLEGEPCRGLYVVKSGRVRVFKSSPEGREQGLLIAQAGDSFNDVPVFDGGPNPASASALEPSVLYLVPGETVLSLIKDCPAAVAIARHMGARLRHLTMMVETLSFRSVVSRLAKLLLDIA